MKYGVLYNVRGLFGLYINRLGILDSSDFLEIMTKSKVHGWSFDDTNRTTLFSITEP